MANPNIYSQTSVVAKCSTVDAAGTSDWVLVSNPAGSGKIYKITNIFAFGEDESSRVFEVYFRDQDDGGGNAFLMFSSPDDDSGNTIPIINGSAFKPFYLLEDKSITVSASSFLQATMVVNYLEIG